MAAAALTMKSPLYDGPIALAMGGTDGFVGDGHLRQAPETVFEAFYSVNLFKAIWLTADYQEIWNPGFNQWGFDFFGVLIPL